MLLAMLDLERSIGEFCDYARSLRGDEKGEAQVFCDRLFRAFGHKGYKEAGATLEERVKLQGGRTGFADLRWGNRVLLEMKKKGQRLGSPKIYSQVFEYWIRLVPNRPRYVVLCNFDELWIYEFDQQVDEPMDRIALSDLPIHYNALAFLLPEEQRPVFKNNRREVTADTARQMGELYKGLTARGETPERAQRFVLQCVMAMFAEDTHLLPPDLFSMLVDDCRKKKESSFDLLGGLFRQMNTAQAARGGRYKGVPYFNGGLYATIDPIELNTDELESLSNAASQRWNRVHPAIFGTLFQNTMTVDERHQRGSHYTPESAIFEHVVLPTLVTPLRKRIREAETLKQLEVIRKELVDVRILDPACGSGNFLYVAYRELKRLEIEVMERIHDDFSAKSASRFGTSASIQINQFFGLDIDPFAVDLAKVTLLLAKKLALDEAHTALDENATSLGFDFDRPLPLENLDKNIRCEDALFCEWPKAQIIIGNPPFQGKNKIGMEFEPEYVKQVRKRFPGVSGRVDYCVYWFRLANEALPDGGRAGLVGTNTITQNYSREEGLDYICNNGGTITQAVSSMVWPGDAVVHVSIANWIKGEIVGQKKLSWQTGNDKTSPWQTKLLDRIPSSLSDTIDVTGAFSLQANEKSGLCYQGQTHGHEGFLLDLPEAKALIKSSAKNRSVIHPYLIGDELLGRLDSGPNRCVIDLNTCDDLMSAGQYHQVFEHLKRSVLPDILNAAEKERTATGKESGPRQSHARKWWKHWRGRVELIERLAAQKRYIACSRVTKRPVFEFITASIHPNDALAVFLMEDDYSFGILQSSHHWEWFSERCSTMKGDARYTSNTVFDTFPWPQSPTEKAVKAVSHAAVSLRKLRHEIMKKHQISLRQLYGSLEQPGKHPLRDAQAALDSAVRDAYGMGPRAVPLAFLLDLNRRCANREKSGESITSPGLPAGFRATAFTTTDAVCAPKL